MRFATTLAVAALFVVALAATPVFAVGVLFEDNFSGTSGDLIGGRVPGVGNTWDAGTGAPQINTSGTSALFDGNGSDDIGTVIQNFTIPTQSSGESLTFEMGFIGSSTTMHRGGFLVFENNNYEYWLPGTGGNTEGGQTDTYWTGSWLNSGAVGAGDTGIASPGTGVTHQTRVTATAQATTVDFVYEYSDDAGSSFNLMGASLAAATMSIPYTGGAGIGFGSGTGPEDPPTFNGFNIRNRPGTGALDVDFVRISETPEPSSLFLITLGSLLVGCTRWRRRKRS